MSWSRTAVRAPSRSISVRARPSSVSSTSSPVASANASVAGSQKRSSASGSRSASARTVPISSGARRPVADLVLERAHAPHPVVARPAEASVDDILDAPPEGKEPDGDDERRHRRDPFGAAADEDAQPDRQACERAHEQGGQRHVDERAVDETLDRVEPVPGHGNSDRDRHGDLDPEQQREHDPVEERDAEDPARGTPRRSRGRARPGRATPPRRARSPAAARSRLERWSRSPDRHRAGDEAGEHADPQQREDSHSRCSSAQVPHRVARHGIRNVGVVAVERAGSKQHETRCTPPKLTIAAPRATQRHLGESSLPFGKTSATAIGHA